MTEKNDKALKKEQEMNDFDQRCDEYLKWRKQKAAEYLKQKEREKCYRCEVEYDGAGCVCYLPLSDDIVARVRDLNAQIDNNTNLKTDRERSRAYFDGIEKIGENIQYDWVEQWDAIDVDDYIYLYGFSVHTFDWADEKNGRRFPVSAYLTDEEYVTVLAHLLHQPDCSFHNLAFLGPEIKAIHDKICDEIHHKDFSENGDGTARYCENHDYAILMTELRADAHKLLDQIEKNGESYPYLNFLNDLTVNICVINAERKGK